MKKNKNVFGIITFHLESAWNHNPLKYPFWKYEQEFRMWRSVPFFWSLFFHTLRRRPSPSARRLRWRRTGSVWWPRWPPGQGRRSHRGPGKDVEDRAKQGEWTSLFFLASFFWLFIIGGARCQNSLFFIITKLLKIQLDLSWKCMVSRQFPLSILFTTSFNHAIYRVRRNII